MQFPIYIPSKGRWESRLTVKALQKLQLDFKVVVEESQLNDYASVIDRSKLLVLDPKYQRDYDACCELAEGESRGSGPARNFSWDHSISQGAKYHWVIDDNISKFFRYTNNRKIQVADGTIFTCMEDFVLRYKNIALAGPQYDFFVPSKEESNVIILNSRVFSCILIRNDIPFRWRARYNEDVDLSLRVLKAGWCTIEFCTFLQKKAPTMTMKGGNTDVLYAGGNTLPKSQMIARLHPDVARVKRKYGRWHHHVDYRPFEKIKPVLREGVVIPKDPNEYGMRLHAI